MGNIDTGRIQTYEEENTFISPSLNNLIKEIDSRITGANCFPVITRTDDLISKIEYYRDVSHTQKMIERNFIRQEGDDGVFYITNILTIFYNEDGTEDSRVETIINRTDNIIQSCRNDFSSGESIC